MKNLFKFLLVFSLILTGTYQLSAQTAVLKANKTAEMVLKDASKKNVSTLKSDYKKALKEISKLQASAAKKVELNEHVANQGGEWITLQTKMERLHNVGVLNFDVEKLDFDSVWKDAKIKTSDFYFEKGKKELDKAKNTEKQLAAFEVLGKASQFDDTHDQEINQLKKEILLPKALALASSWKTSEKLIALKILNDIAEKYSTNEEVIAIITPDRTRLQEEFYKAADKLFKDRNYKDQFKAIEAYELLGDYKDAPLRADLARKRGALTVAVMEEGSDTSLWLNPKTIKQLNKKFPDYVTFNGFEGLTRTELIENKCAILLVYNPKKFGDYTIKHEDGKKQKDIIEYKKKSLKNGKIVEKNISIREYEKGKDLFGSEANNFVAYKGVLQTNWTISTITMNYPFKIIDLREDSVKVLATVEKPGIVSYSFTSKDVETYRGDEKGQPKKLKNVNERADEKAMINKAKKEKIFGWDFDTFLLNKISDIKETIETLFPYRHYAE